jgi:two-component system CheB/CheR fusion protein
LGTAETIGEVPDYFTTVDSKWRIYRSVNKQQAQYVTFAGKSAVPQMTSSKYLETHVLPAAKPPLAQSPDRLLLEALPPSVLVNHKYQVMYTHGDTSKYLRLPQGNPSMSILEMSNPDLRIALSTAVHEAARERKGTIRESLSVRSKNRRQPVKITVRPLSKMDGSLIVTFEDVSRPRRRKLTGVTTQVTQHDDLERELELSRETLRNTIEEMDTANEELRSTNEEYMSANEELKSANEELETSREELRSVNEELTTINTEHEKTIEELTAISDDMHNLLNSTAIATIFLDETLSIRRFTPAATELFNFKDLDVGRPLQDISSRLKADGLPQSARRVLETLIPSEHEVQTEDGHWYSMRVHPYRTSDNSIEGVVASFVDINQMKVALAYAESIIGTIREPLLVLSKKLKILSANSAFCKMFGVNKAETEGQYIYDLGNRQWDIPQLRKLLDSVLKEDKIFEGYRVEYNFPGIGHRKMLLNARRIYDGLSTTQNILLAIEDITGRPGIEAFSEAKEKRKKGAK